MLQQENKYLYLGKIMLSEKNIQYLAMLEDIDRISSLVGTKTYVWGGMTLDIWEGRFLREHGDLDGFVENLEENLAALTQEYQACGYAVKYIHSFSMLEIHRGLVHASFNPLKLDGKIAQWQHIGREGTVYFPADWLDALPRAFYGTKAYTSGLRFEYAIKTKISMLHPTWQLREKDRAAIEQMQKMIQELGIKEEDIYPWIWSYNPYWYKQGYDEFFRPTIAYPLLPK